MDAWRTSPPNRRTRSCRDESEATVMLPVFRRFMQHLCVALLAAGSTVACVRQLPPAPTPPAVAPPIQATTPPPSGQGRLVVDVVDGPTPVQRIDMESQ